MDKARTSLRRRVSVLLVGTLVATWAVVLGATLPAYAAPPANDLIANARVITGIPTQIVQATREASASADDGECGGGDSVWYRFRPTTTSTGRVVTIGSDFDTRLAVFRGPRASRTLVACSDDAAIFASAVQVRFVAGATYWITVSACCAPFSVGGRSVLTLYRPRPAAITASLGSVEAGAVSGRLFAAGTMRCAPLSVAAITVTVSQRVGTLVARGSGFFSGPVCNSTARSWAARVDSDTAVAFRPGLASVTVRGDSFDGFGSALTERTTNVTVGSNPNTVSPG
jgi:hypothetical protein